MKIFTYLKVAHVFLRGGPRRMGQDKFRRKSGCAKATQYDPRGSTAIVYFNTVQCSPKFMAIIVASTNIAVPYRYLDTAVASHAHGHAWHVCPVYIAILYSHGHHQLESSLRRLNFVLDQIIRRCRAPKWWLSFLAWQLATQDRPHIDFFFPFLFLEETGTLRFSKQCPNYVPGIPLFGKRPTCRGSCLKK